MKLFTYPDFESLRSYREQWDGLVQDNPMLGYCWQANWWQTFGQSTSGGQKALALAVIVDQQNGLMGVAPCYVAITSTARILRFLGDGKVSSDYLRLLSRQGYQRQVAAQIAAWIQSPEFYQRYGRLDRIECEGHRWEEPTINLLFEQLSGNGWTKHATSIEGCWRTTLPQTWPALQKKFSKAHYRKSNKANRLRDGKQIDIEWIDTPQELEQRWPELVRLHQKRRSALGQAGCFADSNFEIFLRSTILELSVSGQALLGFIRYDHKNIAATLLLVSQDSAMMYQSGIDPDYSRLEPGHLINHFGLRWGMERGLSNFDFLRGDERYKRDWGAERIALYRTRLIAPRWSSKLKHSLWLTARKAKSITAHWTLPVPTIEEAKAQ